ncbi:MAG: PepSY-associated TM helix domain-containing protein [Gemmatimonadota bacterium]|nr:PepSY-associated TM helix domain-containing protein [Gemmatimonadota bacterium]
MTLPLRKVVFWTHLASGLTAGLVIVIMSVTGVLLTYQRQMTEWSDRQYWTSPSRIGERAPLSRLVAAARSYDPETDVPRIVFYADPDGPVAALFPGGRTLYLDPSTAEVRGENTTGMRAFFREVLRWHARLGLAGDALPFGRAATGWSSAIFLFLVFSGLYLWVPKGWTRRHLAPILLFRRGVRGKARDFNWHNVFGFWVALPLALVVATAITIAFPRVGDFSVRVVGRAPPVPDSASTARAAPETGADPTPTPGPFDVTSADGLVATAMSKVDDWRTITVSLPDETGAPVVFRIDRGWGGSPRDQSTLRLDPVTGAEEAYVTFEARPRRARFRSYLRFAHTGEYYGILGQTIAGIASFAAVLLVWSGFALAWRRLIRPLIGRGQA